MSERSKKIAAILEDTAADTVGSGNTFSARQRNIRKIQPIGFRVVVKIRKDTNMTETGLYLPEGAKNATAESILAEVVEVATARGDEAESEDANVSGIPMGALVLIGKQAGVRIPWDETLRVVDSKEVLALVNEVSLV